MTGIEVIILFCILIVAFLYSSVGHGGASGYLALMALFSFEVQDLRASALMLNVFVSGVAFYQYYRRGHFQWRLFFPFAIASIPMAFLSATLSVDPMIYKKILGICLIFAVLRITGVFGKESKKIKKLPLSAGLLIGGILGFFSGMIGIGGGIILSPIILLFHWAKMKETAAVSALFILANSIAGLIGLLSSDAVFYPKIYLWVLIAVIGGLIGSYMGSVKLSHLKLRYLLAVVLLFASIKLLIL